MNHDPEYDRTMDNLNDPPREDPEEPPPLGEDIEGMDDRTLKMMAHELRESRDRDAQMVATWALNLMAERDSLGKIATERMSRIEANANALERAEMAHIATLQRALESLKEQQENSAKLAAIHSKTNQIAETAIADRTALAAEVQLLRPLADALREYVKFRYFPRLKAAWDLFNKPRS